MKNENENYKILFENIPEAVLIIDFEDRTVFDANRLATDLLDYQYEELTGADLIDLLKDGNTFNKHLDGLQEEGADNSIVLDYIVKDGSRRPATVKTSLFALEGRNLVQCMILPREVEDPDGAESGEGVRGAGVAGQLGRIIDVNITKYLKVYYSGFVMAAALKDLLKKQPTVVDYLPYPDQFDRKGENLDDTQFLIFAVPKLGDLEVEDLKELCKNKRNLPVLVVCLNASNESVISLIKAGVKGVITNENEFNLMPAAVNAISAGELWCPRSILQQVFENYRIRFSTDRSSKGPDKLLSERETEILRLIVKGFKNKEIAEKLGISYSTVINHAYNIYRKLDVNNRAGAIRYAINNRLIGIV